MILLKLFFNLLGNFSDIRCEERRVITERLPASGYEYAEIPDIEVYIKADPKDAIYEYWLPVVKKEDNSGSINN